MFVIHNPCNPHHFRITLLTIMLARPARIALTVLLTIWLNAVVPGHARGVVTIPDGNARCAAPATRCCPKTGKPLKDQAPTDEQKSRCAVCFFAKGLSDQTGGVITLEPLGFLHTRPLAPPRQPASLQLICTYLGRAPPAA